MNEVYEMLDRYWRLNAKAKAIIDRAVRECRGVERERRWYRVANWYGRKAEAIGRTA